jgi:hypothetical protein
VILHQFMQGSESDIFRTVIVPSIVLAVLIGLLTTLQAYWSLMLVMVPMPPGGSGKFKVRTGGFPDCDVLVLVSKDCFMGLFLE